MWENRGIIRGLYVRAKRRGKGGGVGIAGLTFLVAEDEPVQRTLLVSMLKSQGAENVYSANDGREALDVLTKQSTAIDVTVCDLHMPGMDGLQLIRRMGEADYRGSFIIASALGRTLLASAEATAKAYGVKLLGVISKPVTPAALEALLTGLGARHAKTGPRSDSLPPFTSAEIIQGLDQVEFEPFFQPKVELATGRVAGAEALARWRHPEQGIAAPGAFLKLLEESGKIDDLTWLVLGKAVAFCSAFCKAGLNATVGINVSLTSLSRVDFADRVYEIVHGQNLGPEKICLEITESAATSNLGAAALENLTRVRMMGFGLSIDDCGTGASSIQQLTHIPFTELKIDRSLITKSATDKSAMSVLKAGLDTARELGIDAVAEGVETLEQWTMLQELGCKFAQGYFIAEPMDAKAYVAWVRSLAMEPIFYSARSPKRGKLQ